MSIIKPLFKGWVLWAVIGLAACATAPEPFEYHPDTEVKPGRGVFTGEEGTWTIYRVDGPAEAEPAPVEKSTDGSTGRKVEADPAAADKDQSP